MSAFFFLVFGIGCIAYTVVAVQILRQACSRYPQCVQISHFLIPGASKDVCQCVAYVDRDLAPASSEIFADVTHTLAKLAVAGKLQSVQLVNRKINGSLLDELRGCRNLRNVVYQNPDPHRSGDFPSWTSSSFTNLEYLAALPRHVEGDSSDTNLVELSTDLFALMLSLHTIHLSYHSSLPSLPSLNGLKTLECVYFGYLDSITELPSTGNLPAIQVMALEGLRQVRLLPDVDQYESTLEMMFVQNVPACCSGFLSGGDCNTTFPSCCESHENKEGSNSTNSLPPTCLVMPDENYLLPTNATLSILNQFAANSSNFCGASQATCPNSAMHAAKLINDVCEGVLYRNCSSGFQGPGICFNEDMGRVECTYSQDIIDMRKAETKAGCDCDKVEEQWLGCT